MSISMTRQKKYGNQKKLCYTDTSSFLAHIKSENVYVGFAGDVGKRIDTLNYEFNRPLFIEETRK